MNFVSVAMNSVFFPSSVISFLLILFIDLSLIIHHINSSNGVIVQILMFILNFSFDAILVIYINKISIPPIIIKNKIYENQKF